MAMSACIHHVVSMSVTHQDNGSGVKWTAVLMYDKRGEYDEHAANLVAIGHVTAACNDDAWKKAKLLTVKPVLEEIKE